MKMSSKHPYAVFIDDVDFNEMTDDLWAEIGKIHMSNLVTIIRNCNVQHKDISKWTKKWGPNRYSGMYFLSLHYPEYSAKEIIIMALKDNPKIAPAHCDLVKNRFKTKGPSGTQRVTDMRDKRGDHTGIFPDGELKWHSNEAGNHIFAPGVALLGVQNMVGSCTGFLETATYYENISESFRSELDDMIMIHKYKPGALHVKDLGKQDEMMRFNMHPEEESHLPMVIQSPGGIKGLHYSINTVDGVVGMSKQESDKLFERINEELMPHAWDHWYENDNDWLFFDNSITNHRRLGEVNNRLGLRIQHGYENIQIENYNPYFQEDHAKIYDDRLAALYKFTKDNFNED